MLSYVSTNEEYISGIKKWLKKEKIEKETQVAEVFAGTGIIGKALGLNSNNITDIKAWEDDDSLTENKDEEWLKAVENVTKRDAVVAINDFKENEDDIKLLIIGAPDHSDDSAFRCIVNLNRIFPDSKILYIGPEEFSKGNGQVATEEFFKHTQIISDDEFFIDKVQKEYDKSQDYFYKNWMIESYPSLRKFKNCTDQGCVCNNANIPLTTEEPEDDYDDLDDIDIHL